MLDQGTIIRNQVTYDSAEPSVWGVLEDNPDQKKDSSSIDDNEPTKQSVMVEVPAGPGQKTEEDLSRQTGDTECYKIYIRSMGAKVLAVVFGVMVVNIAMSKMPRPCQPSTDKTRNANSVLEIWLRLWTEKGTTADDLDYMGGYVAFVVSSILLGLFDLG